jgi:hypothetical protein
VRLHTSHFLKKVQQRNWKAVPTFMADDFSDRWGHTKASAMEDARQVFSQFIFLTIENRTDQCEVHDKDATASTRIKVSGNGSAIAQIVMERVNGLQQPFVFTWHKAGSSPWEWQLTHIDQPELNIDPGAGF